MKLIKFFLINLLLISNIYAAECNQSLQYDSGVLSLQWYPTVCPRYYTKTFCAEAANNNSSKLTIHGLWPNKTDCDTEYGSCGEIKTENELRAKTQGDFSNLKDIALSQTVYNQLLPYMPSILHYLHRHEWWKHGTCSGLSVDNFFTLTLNLSKEFINSQFVQNFLYKNIGQTIAIEEFNNKFDDYFGQDSHKAIKITCVNNQLNELLIRIDKNPMINYQPEKQLDFKQILLQDQNYLPNSECNKFFIPDFTKIN